MPCGDGGFGCSYVSPEWTVLDMGGEVWILFSDLHGFCFSVVKRGRSEGVGADHAVVLDFICLAIYDEEELEFPFHRGVSFSMG